MFTRAVELKAKPGKTNRLCSVTSERVLPILKKQQGFQGEIVLFSNTEPDRMLVLSFWNKREDAERHHREQFPRLIEMLRPLYEGEPLFGSDCSILRLGTSLLPRPDHKALGNTAK